MLDVRFFKNPRFSAASAGVTLIFFAMFGATFLLTQYYQFIMGYTPLQAGIRLLPWAATMLVVAPMSARLAERFGTKIVVASGLALAGLALTLMAGLPAHNISYPGDVLWRIILMAVGMALVMAPATESIMGSLPRAKAGVGSAVNDTTRQIGGALGVAIVGSVLTAVYGSRVASAITHSGVRVSPAVVDSAKQSLDQAFRIAAQAPANVRPGLIAEINDAFVSAMHYGVLVSAAAAFIGAIIVWIWLPARAVESTEVAPPAAVEEIPALAAVDA
jgi:Na+/melibiose symporter-like transporter